MKIPGNQVPIDLQRSLAGSVVDCVVRNLKVKRAARFTAQMQAL
jgi:hypothetical protein